jgi:hypothetical protein
VFEVGTPDGVVVEVWVVPGPELVVETAVVEVEVGGTVVVEGPDDVVQLDTTTASVAMIRVAVTQVVVTLVFVTIGARRMPPPPDTEARSHIQGYSRTSCREGAPGPLQFSGDPDAAWAVANDLHERAESWGIPSALAWSLYLLGELNSAGDPTEAAAGQAPEHFGPFGDHYLDVVQRTVEHLDAGEATRALRQGGALDYHATAAYAIDLLESL